MITIKMRIVIYLEIFQTIKKNIFPQNVQNSWNSMRIRNNELSTFFVHTMLIFKMTKDGLQKIFSLAPEGRIYNLITTN